MSIATHFLIQDAKVLSTSSDKYGDQVMSGNAVNILCRFRYITEIDKGTNREGETASEAIIWLEPDAKITEGSIIQVDSVYWRVNKLVKARGLSISDVLFQKAYVKRHQIT